MPKRNIEISSFDKGLITSVNPQDIDVNAMSYSENLDANQNGKLQGILGNSVKSSTLGLGYQRGGFLHRLTGQYDLIYTDGVNINTILDFYGTPSGSTILSGVVGKTFLREGRHFYIGTGNDSSHPTKWVGYTDYQPMGGIGQTTFTGTGVDDVWAYGNYTDTVNHIYKIVIIATGANDTFKVQKDGVDLVTGISIATNQFFYLIENGIGIYFANETGHVVSDNWAFTANAKNLTIAHYNAQLSTYDAGLTFSAASDGEVFMIGTVSGGTAIVLHRYAYSLTYDGVNESILNESPLDLNTDGTFNSESITLIIKNGATSLSAIDSRITGINLYLAVSTDLTAANLGLYKLVQSATMNSLSPDAAYYPTTVIGFQSYNYSTTSFLPEGADRASYISVIAAMIGQSYEQITGIPQNADPVILNYNLSAELNGYAFVMNGYENSLTYSDLMLFRSKAGAFGAFDIINNSMWLGFNPVAVKAFNGKLYIWDTSHTYVVDPDGLFIQDILPGVGCSNDRSVEAIEVEQAHALVWSDANNIYLTQGSGIIPIGDAIKVPAESGALNWQGIVNSSAIIIYDAVKQLVLIFISKVANTDTQVFAYHIIKKRWDYFPDFAAASTFITGAFMGINGETYAATSANLYNNFGSTSNRAWIYIGSELIMGLAKQPKKYYNFKIDSAGTGTITPYYSINKGSSYRGLTSPDLIQDVSGIWEKQNSIRLKLTGAVGSCYVNAIELLYRIMDGVR